MRIGLPGRSRAPSPEQTLRRLFLMLFIRGRTSRSLQKETLPRSVGSKLWMVLSIYALLGLFAGLMYTEPLFALSIYLHATTFLVLGMFVSASAGEVLFNKEEADILMHRPITSRALLWAKVGVLTQVSLWLALAFNIAGFVVGVIGPSGGWSFLPVHLFSTVVSALFCTGCVVLIYQLCLRWFGREKLDGLMTMAQVLASVTMLLASQLLPRFIGQFGGVIGLSAVPWWIRLLPPVWFAGIDDALSGSHAAGSWWFAALAVAATGGVLWLAFGKMAAAYESGLRGLNEVSSTTAHRSRRRWLDAAVKAPPLKWWLRDPVARASFLLTAAYLLRDRETKLRVYPGVAPMLVMPAVMLLNAQRSTGVGGFGVAFAAIYVGLVPLVALDLVRYSQQWQAADLFRAVPVHGPGPFCHGARRAVLSMLALPAMIVVCLVALLMQKRWSGIELMLPAIVALPIYAMIPCLKGKAVPFSASGESIKAASRVTTTLGVMIVSALWAAAMNWGRTHDLFWQFLLVEIVIASGAYAIMRASVGRARWASVD